MVNAKEHIIIFRFIFLFVFFSFFFQNTLAQQKEDFETWLEMNQDGKSAIVSAKFINNTDVDFTFTFLLQIDQVGKEGKKNIKRSSIFYAAAYHPLTLSIFEIDIDENEFYRFTFEVFDGTERIGVDFLESQNFELAEQKAILADSLNTISFVQQIEETKGRTKDAFDEIEIDGLVIDNTRSKLGRDFYDYFYTNWSAPRQAKDFIITIHELPARGRMAQIAVDVNGNVLVRRSLQPRGDFIENLAGQVATAIADYLIKNEDLKQQLGSDDAQGSGIY